MLKKAASDKYVNRLEQKVAYEASRPKTSYIFNEFNDIFQGDSAEKAAEVLAKEKKTKKAKAK